jgi:predicted Zn-dependent peptidase
MKAQSLRKIVFLFFLLPLISTDSPLFSQERFRKTPPIPEPLPALELPEIRYILLANGFRVGMIQQGSTPIISFKVIIFSGESSSPQELPGLAALTANSLIRGVSEFSSTQIEERIEYIGGKYSTIIHPDFSMLSFTFLEEYLDQALDLVSRMLMQPTLQRREIDSVRTVLYYDLLNKSDDPEFIAKRQLLRLLFKNHSYEKIIYNEDVLKFLTQRDVTSFFNTHYRPNNAQIVITGNLNLEDTASKARHYFGRWQRKEIKHPSSLPPESFKSTKVCLISTPGAKDATIYIGNVIVPPTHTDIFPLMVMNQVLGGTPNSRLFMNLRESKEFAYDAHSEIEFYKDCSVFSVHARVRPEVVESSVQEILNEIKLITNEIIPGIEIEQAKSHLIGNFPLQIETFDELTSKLAEIKAFDLGEEHWERYYKNIMDITSETLFEMAGKIPLLTPAIVIVGDQDIVLNQFGAIIKEVDIYSKKGIYLGTYKIE